MAKSKSAPKADTPKKISASTSLANLKVKDLKAIITQMVGAAMKTKPRPHANSGPTHHANKPGHANFTKVKSKAKLPTQKRPHANSGPTKHANRPGHANFS